MWVRLWSYPRTTRPSFLFSAIKPTSGYTWCSLRTFLPTLCSSLRMRTGLRSQWNRTSGDMVIHTRSYYWRSSGESLLHTQNYLSRLSSPPRTGLSWTRSIYTFSHLSYAFACYHSTTITTILVFIASCLLWPQNPLPYDRESFLNSTNLDNCSAVLVELPANPVAEEGLPPHVVMELHFAQFQERHLISQFDKKCWWVCCPVYDIWKNY